MSNDQLWPREWTQEAAGKTCPECAERVQAAANVCRFCGYRFDGRAAAAPKPVAALDRKSTAAAGWLGFLFTGLGHLYVGELVRAALLLASVGLIVIGSELGAEPVYGLAVIVWIFSIVDARRGAEHRNEGGRARSPKGGIWAIAAIGAIGLTIGVATAPASGLADAASIADQIRPELERQLQAQITDATVSVSDVSCVAESSSGGTCLAEVSDSLGNQERVSITYSQDSTTGQMIWHTD